MKKLSSSSHFPACDGGCCFAMQSQPASPGCSLGFLAKHHPRENCSVLPAAPSLSSHGGFTQDIRLHQGAALGSAALPGFSEVLTQVIP